MNWFLTPSQPRRSYPGEAAQISRIAALTLVDQRVVETRAGREGGQGQVVVHLWVFVLQPDSHTVVGNLNLQNSVKKLNNENKNTQTKEGEDETKLMGTLQYRLDVKTRYEQTGR